MGKRVAVVLAGCGVFDGTEIHEASAILVHLSRGDASVRTMLLVFCSHTLASPMFDPITLHNIGPPTITTILNSSLLLIDVTYFGYPKCLILQSKIPTNDNVFAYIVFLCLHFYYR